MHLEIIDSFPRRCRKGAPFLATFLDVASRLEDTGLIKHWMENVMTKRAKDTRAKADPNAVKVFDIKVLEACVLVALV